MSTGWATTHYHMLAQLTKKSETGKASSYFDSSILRLLLSKMSLFDSRNNTDSLKVKQRPAITDRITPTHSVQVVSVLASTIGFPIWRKLGQSVTVIDNTQISIPLKIRCLVKCHLENGYFAPNQQTTLYSIVFTIIHPARVPKSTKDRALLNDRCVMGESRM